MAHRLALVVVATAMLAGGCASVQTSAPSGAAPVRRPVHEVDAAAIHPDPVRFEGDDAYAFFDGATGKALRFDDVVDRARAAQAVVVAEQHDQAAHHELQRRMVVALAQGNDKLSVGLEMLPWSAQGAVDRFNDGEVDARAFAASVDWQKVWGFPFDLYARVLEDGRAAGARFLALNAPRELVRAVRKKGVDGLSDRERRALPELDLGDATHKAWFKGIFAEGGHPMNDADVESFYTAQVLWDETMADGVVQALRAGARQVVVLAGVGHVARGRGIPQRVERRIPGARVLSIVPLTDVDEDNADARLRGAVARGEGDIIAVVHFEAGLAL